MWYDKFIYDGKIQNMDSIFEIQIDILGVVIRKLN